LVKETLPFFLTFSHEPFPLPAVCANTSVCHPSKTPFLPLFFSFLFLRSGFRKSAWLQTPLNSAVTMARVLHTISPLSLTSFQSFLPRSRLAPDPVLKFANLLADSFFVVLRPFRMIKELLTITHPFPLPSTRLPSWLRVILRPSRTLEFFSAVQEPRSTMSS